MVEQQRYEEGQRKINAKLKQRDCTNERITIS